MEGAMGVESFYKEAAINRVEVLEEEQGALQKKLDDQEVRMASMALKIRRLEAELERASRDAVESFKASAEFADLSRARYDKELREVLTRIVDGVHSQYPGINFLMIKHIGIFGELYLETMGKRKWGASLRLGHIEGGRPKKFFRTASS